LRPRIDCGTLGLFSIRKEVPIPRRAVPPPTRNEVPKLLAQLQDYWFHGPQKRFAQDAGITPTTFSRILRGQTNPRYSDMLKIVALLEKKLGRKLDPRDVYVP